MGKKILFADSELSISVENGSIEFFFHPSYQGWLHTESCPLTAAAIIYDSEYKNNENVLDIEIKDYIGNFNKYMFVYWLTGGNAFWMAEAYTSYGYVYEKIIKEDAIVNIINEVPNFNTIRDVIKAIDKYKYDIAEIVYEYNLENYNVEDV